MPQTIWYEAKELMDSRDDVISNSDLFELEIDPNRLEIHYVPKRIFKPVHSDRFGQAPQIIHRYRAHDNRPQSGLNQRALAIIKLRMKLQELKDRISVLERKMKPTEAVRRASLQDRGEENENEQQQQEAVGLSCGSLLWFAWPILVQMLLMRPAMLGFGPATVRRAS